MVWELTRADITDQSISQNKGSKKSILNAMVGLQTNFFLDQLTSLYADELSTFSYAAVCFLHILFLVFFTPRQVNIEPILPSVNPHVVPIPILKDGQLDLLVLVNPDTINNQTNSVPEIVILTYFPKRVNRLVDVTSRRTLKQISKWG